LNNGAPVWKISTFSAAFTLDVATAFYGSLW